MKSSFYPILMFAFLILISCENIDMSNIKEEKTINNQNTSQEKILAPTNFTPIFKPVKDLIAANSNKSFKMLLKYDVKAYRVEYKTKDVSNNEVTASGTILVPISYNSDDSFPILSYQHGTMFGDVDVYNSSFNNEVFCFASSGFITLVPDYLGYKTSSQIQHPYFINKTSNETVRDMILESLIDIRSLGINHNGQLFLNGFSEGANVSISFLKSIEENPILGLQIKATAASSGAYALGDQFSYILYNYFNNNMLAPATNPILCYMIYGYDKNIAKTNNLSIYFSSPYNNLVPYCFSGNFDSTSASNFFNSYKASYPQILSTLFVNSLNNGANLSFKKYLDDNSLIINWTPSSKLMLYHASDDYLVPKLNTTKLYDKMTENISTNANVSKDVYEGIGHSSTISFEKAIVWLNSNR